MLLNFHTDTPPQSPTTMTLIGPPVRTARKLTSSCVCNNVITTMDAQQKGITLSRSLALSLCLSSSGHCYDHNVFTRVQPEVRGSSRVSHQLLLSKKTEFICTICPFQMEKRRARAIPINQDAMLYTLTCLVCMLFLSHLKRCVNSIKKQNNSIKKQQHLC